MKGESEHVYGGFGAKYGSLIHASLFSDFSTVFSLQ